MASDTFHSCMEVGLLDARPTRNRETDEFGGSVASTLTDSLQLRVLIRSFDEPIRLRACSQYREACLCHSRTDLTSCCNVLLAV